MSDTHPLAPPDEDLRRVAITRIRKRRELQAHVIAYLAVNLFLNALWYFGVLHAFYWPVFPLFGWGIGLAFHIWDVYSPAEPTEDRIEREIRRLAHR